MGQKPRGTDVVTAEWARQKLALGRQQRQRGTTGWAPRGWAVDRGPCRPFTKQRAQTNYCHSPPMQGRPIQAPLIILASVALALCSDSCAGGSVRGGRAAGQISHLGELLFLLPVELGRHIVIEANNKWQRSLQRSLLRHCRGRAETGVREGRRLLMAVVTCDAPWQECIVDYARCWVCVVEERVIGLPFFGQLQNERTLVLHAHTTNTRSISAE